MAGRALFLLAARNGFIIMNDKPVCSLAVHARAEYRPGRNSISVRTNPPVCCLPFSGLTCWGQADVCWEMRPNAGMPPQQHRDVDTRRLYEEIGEQWMLVADQIADSEQSRAVLAAR